MRRSPHITGLSWGRVDTEVGGFKDAKLWPGGARGWDWNETGTRHQPGILAIDVAELLDAGAEHVVLSQGQQRRLQVTAAALGAIRDRGAVVEVLPTPEAAERYNDLATEGSAVAALIHSTC